MVLNDNDSSWVAQHLVEEINIREAEDMRPSVRLKPTLKRVLKGLVIIGWQAIYGDFGSAVGSSPDEAMCNFDTEWYKKKDQS